MPIRSTGSPIGLLSTLLALAAACTTTDDDADDGADDGPATSADSSGDAGEGDAGSSSATTGAAGLEIAGAWLDDFGGAHVIDDGTWATTYAPDTFTYTIDSYDNALRVVIAQDDADGTWSKYEWTYASEALYYCQSAFGLDSAAAAMAAEAADPADPATAGCGGFAWSQLTPQ